MGKIALTNARSARRRGLPPRAPVPAESSRNRRRFHWELVLVAPLLPPFRHTLHGGIAASPFANIPTGAGAHQGVTDNTGDPFALRSTVRGKDCSLSGLCGWSAVASSARHLFAARRDWAGKSQARSRPSMLHPSPHSAPSVRGCTASARFIRVRRVSIVGCRRLIRASHLAGPSRGVIWTAASTCPCVSRAGLSTAETVRAHCRAGLAGRCGARRARAVRRAQLSRPAPRPGSGV